MAISFKFKASVALWALCALAYLASVSVAAAQVVVTGAKTTTAASVSGYASKNTPQGSTPTSLADGDEWYDSTQLAMEFRQATNTTLVRGGAVSGCYNFTPVSWSAGGTGPATLQTCSGLTPTVLNVLNKLLKIHAEGYLTIPTGGTTASATFTVTLGGTTLCSGSGLQISVGASNAHWELTCYAGAVVQGSSGAFNVQGQVGYRTSATTGAAINIYGIVNTANVGTFNLTSTSPSTIAVIVALSANNAMNVSTVTETQLLVDVEN